MNFHSPLSTPARLEWISSFPLATSRFILYDMAKVLFWSAALILSIGSLIALAQGAADASLEEWLAPIGVFFLCLSGIGLLLLFVMVAVFGNRFRACFTIGPQGIGYEMRSRAAHWSSRAAVVAGVLAASPGAVGAGLIAASQEEVSYTWQEVRRVKFHPRHLVITVMNGWRVVLRLYCTPDNYQEACRLMRLYMPGAAQ